MSQQAVCNGHLDDGRNLVSTALSGIRGVATPEFSAHLSAGGRQRATHMHRNELTSCVRALKEAANSRLTVPHQPVSRAWTRWFTEEPIRCSSPLVLAAACLAAGLPGPAQDTQLVAQQLS